MKAKSLPLSKREISRGNYLVRGGGITLPLPTTHTLFLCIMSRLPRLLNENRVCKNKIK